MAECTEAERALIEACMELPEEEMRYVTHTPSAKLIDALAAVFAERVTPELKKRLRENYQAQRSLQRESSELAKGIPNHAWRRVLDEVYPKDTE